MKCVSPVGKMALIALFLSLLVCMQSAGAVESVPGNKKPFVIKNVRIFDGASLLTDTAILVENGVISEIGQFKVMELPPGTEIIDGTGNTVMPGLIDCNAHVCNPISSKDPEGELRKDLIFGVTTELDSMTDPAVVSRIRKLKVEGGGCDMADIRTSGFILTPSGGMGAESHPGSPPLPKSGEIDSWIKARIKEGSEYIKIVLDDGRSLGQSFPTIDRMMLSEAIKATHGLHRLAIVRAGSIDSAIEAASCDADGLAHLMADRMPPKNFGAILRSHNTFAIPTLNSVESMYGVKTGLSLIQDPRLIPYLSEADMRILSEAINADGCTIRPEYVRECMRQMIDSGVPIMAGTGAEKPGSVHGAGMHREFELLLDCGLTHRQVLAAATSVPAKLFGLDDRGRLAPEYRADMVMVKGDPTEDMRATRAIITVWKDGIAADREAYRKSLAK